MNCRQADIIGYSIFLEMRFLIAFGVPEKSVFTRLFRVFATCVLANFQDRLVMTTSISLRVFNFIKNRNPSQGKLRENCEKRFSQSTEEPAKNPTKSRVFKKLHKQTKEVFKTASL